MLKHFLIILIVTYFILAIKYNSRISSDTNILNVDDFCIKTLNDRVPLYIKNIDNIRVSNVLNSSSRFLYYDVQEENNKLLKHSLSDGIMFFNNKKETTTTTEPSVVYLFNPSHTPNLYEVNDINVYKNWEQISEIDVLNPDLNKFPKYTNTEYTAIPVSVGDGLYIPFGWWYVLENPDTFTCLKWNSYISVLLRPFYISYIQLNNQICQYL